MSEPSLVQLSAAAAADTIGGRSANGGVAAPNTDHYNPSVREVNIPKLPNGACGFDLSRSKWDPYPWVGSMLYHIRFIQRACAIYCVRVCV